MSLTESQLRELSSLVDTLQALPEFERAAWLAELPAAQGIYRPTLERLLDRDANVETADFLLTLPKLEDVAERKADGLVAGMEIGPYRLIRELGAGGMGEVWLAERSDGVLKRSVALKLPMLSLKRSVLVQRFERERDILASLTHPNIARLYDAGLTGDGQPYLALEYVEGEPITEYARRNKLDTCAQISLLLQVMQAVQYAHANLVIHRDLKPANVLVTAEGKALLLDFGIAKLLEEDVSHAQETELTRAGGRALTLGYAAPEQVTGAPISTATDVYALGVLLYEMLTQHRPFSGAMREVEQAILTAEPARPQGLPTDLVTVMLKALKKNPDERYATVNSFAADLENWLQGSPVSAQPDSAAYRFRKFIGRHRLGVASAVVVCCALIAATGVSLWQASIARRESQTAAAVETFLTGIFKANSSYQSDPEKARKTTARELMDIGAKRIATELQDAPEAKLRMLTLLAELYREVTLAEPALALYRQQVEMLRQMEPADSVKLALALANLGDRAAQANAKEESQKAYGEAIAILDRRGDSATPERGRVEVQLAGALLDWMDPTALEAAKRAVSILKRHPPSDELLWAMEVQAYLTSQQGDRQASLKLAREALEIALGMPDVNHHALVGLHLSLGRQLAQDNQVNAAEASMRTAHEMALAKEGPDSHLTLNAALEIGTLLYRNGEYVKALAVYDPAANSAQRALDKGDRSWLNLVVVTNHGDTLMKFGHVEKGLEILVLAQKARDILDVKPPRDTMLREQVAEAHAMRGAHSAAEIELDAAEKVIREKMEGNKREIENLTRARLRCALIRGDKLRTPELAAQAKLTDVPTVEAPNAALRRLVLLAEAQFVTGHLPGALMAATQLINTLPQSTAPAFDGDRERRASLVAGKVHFLQGHAELALPLFQRAVSLADGRLDTQTSADHADSLIWLGQAQLATGHAQEARQMARQAKEIHDRHPQLEENFRKPLANLNARLRA